MDWSPKTKKILKSNGELIENLYDKLEKGELNHIRKEENGFFLNLKKIPKVIKLFGYNNNNKDLDNIQLKVDEIKEDDLEDDLEVEEIISKKSDSSNSLMDFDVVCDEKNEFCEMIKKNK